MRKIAGSQGRRSGGRRVQDDAAASCGQSTSGVSIDRARKSNLMPSQELNVPSEDINPEVMPVICRLWRGWTTKDDADAYERIVRGQVIPGIEARHIPGFLSIDLVRRERTTMWSS
jgi:hypothetical protein